MTSDARTREGLEPSVSSPEQLPDGGPRLFFRDLAIAGLVAVLYFLSGRIGLAFVVQPQGVAALWPASGVLLGALLVVGTRKWFVIIPTVFASVVFVNLSAGNGVALSLAFAVANCLESTAAAWLVLRVLGGTPNFDRLRDVLVFAVGAAVVTNAVTALVAASLVGMGTGGPFWKIWETWWVEDGVGMLVVAPLFLVAARIHNLHSSRRRCFEISGWLLLLLVASFWVFGAEGESSIGFRLPYILVPLSLILVFRHGLAGAVLGTLAIASAAVWGGARGTGLFALQFQRASDVSLLATQIYVAAVCVTSLIVSGLYAERLRSKDMLQHERDLLQTVMDGTGNAHLAYLDRDFNFVRVNAVYAATHACRPEEMVGKNHFVLDPHAGHRAIFARVRDTGEPFAVHDGPFEFPDQPERGTTYWDWALTPVKDRRGNVEGLVLSLFDTTERKRADEALREREEEFRALFEQAGDYSLLLEPGSEGPIIVDANEAACRIHGFSREELVGTPILSLNTEIGEERSRAVVEGTLSGETVRFETSHRRKDGSVFPVEVSAKAIHRVGKPPIILSTERDVTQRKQLEGQLRQAQKMEAIGTLAGGIAHDFNNILTPIVAHAELGLMQPDNANALREDLTQILAAAERATSLVKLILTISRREEGSVPVPVALGDLIKETAKFFRASLPTTIEIRTDIDAACGPVLGEVSQLQQVLLNLCTNAGHAMREKGGVLTVSLRSEGGRVRLAVRDTGTGIRQENLGRIFEPYFTTKPVGQGSGLGLAVVHGIVAKFGGEVRVQSALGVGTTFEVLLPETSRFEPTHSLGPRAPSRGDGQNVLVVDDETAVRSVLAKLVAALGYRVTEAAGSTEALVAFRAAPHEFDAVVTDYTMPGMSGFELAGELLRFRPDLPVVLGTGFAEGVSEEVAVERGLRGLVMKPYNLQRLGDVLARALAGGSH